MVGESLINPCACPMHRRGQWRHSSSRGFITNHIGLALGSVPTVGGVGGHGDRRRLSLRGKHAGYEPGDSRTARAHNGMRCKEYYVVRSKV